MSDPAERAAERIADDISEDNEREAWIAEAADIIRAEYKWEVMESELMPCGHRQACYVHKHWRPCYDDAGPAHGVSVICDGNPNHCTACERERKLVEVGLRMQKLGEGRNITFEDVKREAGR